MGQGGFHASDTQVKGCCNALQSKLIYSNAVGIFIDTHAAHDGHLIIHDFTYLLLPASSKDFIDILYLLLKP